MAKFRKIHTEFWNDPTVMEEMTPEDKYFFLYLLTNPNTKQIGIYEITRKQMAFDMGYSVETISSLLDRFENHHKIIKYNPKTRELAIKNWGKYNLNRGGKPVIDCVVSELKEVKDLSLIEYVGKNVENSKIKALYDTYYDTSTIRTQEEEKEEEEEKEKEEEDYVSKIKDLLTLFSTINNFEQLNKDYWNVISETRKTGKISASVIYNTMNKWKKYDPVVIEYALKEHIEKHRGKREEYTIGIMRNTSKEEALSKLRVTKNKTVDFDELRKKFGGVQQ